MAPIESFLSIKTRLFIVNDIKDRQQSISSFLPWSQYMADGCIIYYLKADTTISYLLTHENSLNLMYMHMKVIWREACLRSFFRSEFSFHEISKKK